MTLRVGACQTPEILGDPEAALRTVAEFARQADVAGLDLLLFPECFLQGYLVTPKHLQSWAVDLAGKEFAAILDRLAPIRQILVLGLIERRNGRFFNTAAVIAAGRVICAYRKVHLTEGESTFTAGDSYPIFPAGDVHFGINICFDTRFPRAAAAVAAQGAQALLVPAQNMMRHANARLWQNRHHQIRAERARETGMWLASADVTGERDSMRIGLGPTGIIDPSGRVVSQVPVGTVGLAAAEIVGGAQ